MNHKPWHPSSVKNLEQVWLAQQEEKLRQAKLRERLRILEEERKIERMQKEELQKSQNSSEYNFKEDLEGLGELLDEHINIDVNGARSPYDLYVYGKSMLTRELEFRGMDTSGTAMDMAVRLYAVRGLAKEDIPQKYLKNNNKNGKRRSNEDNSVTWCLSQEISTKDTEANDRRSESDSLPPYLKAILTSNSNSNTNASTSNPKRKNKIASDAKRETKAEKRMRIASEHSVAGIIAHIRAKELGLAREN
eukprot:CAMPEP_0184478510 /NCGR_PEP_ID=MMETSP0113_2-20130426/514_1 /TAXON_ID=91329 /ORGANISM="Norrisiella sphaerica, Strain BC52" /LENGTH=248 /DNA_ID=CAMNT_0026856325 /DNA_START=214 /DNA_END=960 /DNA_ORIENTATION=-